MQKLRGIIGNLEIIIGSFGGNKGIEYYIGDVSSIIYQGLPVKQFHS